MLGSGQSDPNILPGRLVASVFGVNVASISRTCIAMNRLIESCLIMAKSQTIVWGAPVESRYSDASGGGRGGEVPGHEDTQSMTSPSSAMSIWDKAKAAIAGVSMQATSTGGALASKVAAISTAGAAKTVEVSNQTLAVAGDMTRGAVETSVQFYAGSKLESAVNYVDGELDQRGAKKAIRDTTGAVVDKLDQVTGKRLIELVEAKLLAQDSFNDILATRLAEALERIANLEGQLSELKIRGACHEN